MKKLSTLLGLCAIVLLLGTGCSEKPADTTTLIPKPESQDKVSEETLPINKNKIDEAMEKEETIKKFTLEHEILEDNKIKFTWSVPENTELTEKFRLVRSEEENPIFDGKNYWVQAHKTHREIVWEEFPSGDYHVRACIFDVDNEECLDYSNDLLVNIE